MVIFRVLLISILISVVTSSLEASACRSRIVSLADVPRLRITPSPLNRIPIRDLWLQYEKSPSTEIRNFFVETYLHLIDYQVGRISMKLPEEVDPADLQSAGVFGLMDAVDGFELSRGIKFETYAAPRIKGAILDYLRAIDWVPRLVRHRDSERNVVIQEFEMAHGRRPSAEEMPALLKAYLESMVDDKLVKYEKGFRVRKGRSPTDEELEARRAKLIQGLDKAVEDILKEGGPVRANSLNRRVPDTSFAGGGGKESSLGEALADPTIGTRRLPGVLSEIQRKDLKALLSKGLSRAERLVIILYYFDEMTMRDIGAALDLSESRVSQMHTSILARLKAQMTDRQDELEPEN